MVLSSVQLNLTDKKTPEAEEIPSKNRKRKLNINGLTPYLKRRKIWRLVKQLLYGMAR